MVVDLKRLQILFRIEFQATVGNDLIESRFKVGLRQIRKLAPQCPQQARVLMTERDQAVELTGNLKTLSHSARSLQSPPAFAHTTPDRGLRHYDTRFG